MKLQIVELDPTDDRTSVGDKLSRVQAERTLLVWPRRGSPLSSRLELALIQRKARDLGVQLGLLSHDPDVIDAARQLDLPLFDSVEQATQAEWPARAGVSFRRRPERLAKDSVTAQRSSRPTSRWQARHYPNWLRLLLMILATLALLALAAFTLPSATIELEPSTIAQRQSFTIYVSPDEGELAEYTIRGHIHQTSVSRSQRKATSGTSQVPDEFATGQLLFINLTDEAVTIPAGASVRTSQEPAIRFSTSEQAELAAGSATTVEVAAQAVMAGPQGNVQPETINAVDGPLGLRVQVTNPESFSGGTNQPQAIVSSADQEALMADLEASILELGQQALQESMPPGHQLIEASVAIEEIVESTFDAEIDQAAASLGLDLTAQVAGLAYERADIESLLLEQLSRSPGNRQLQPGSLRFSVENSFAQNNRIGLEILASWQEYQPIDQAAFSQALIGKPDDFNWHALEEKYQVQVVRSAHKPDWFPTFPLLANRIEIRYPWQAE